MGAPLGQFLRLLYSYRRPPQISFFATIWGPLRSVSSHTIWGSPQTCFIAYYIWAPIPTPSGVVGRERMGTAFPHKKLSGNGVPTRETLRVTFLIDIFHCHHVTTFRASETISKLDIRI